MLLSRAFVFVQQLRRLATSKTRLKEQEQLSKKRDLIPGNCRVSDMKSDDNPVGPLPAKITVPTEKSTLFHFIYFDHILLQGRQAFGRVTVSGALDVAREALSHWQIKSHTTVVRLF